MRRSRLSFVNKLWLLVSMAFFLVAFQNCGKGFQTNLDPSLLNASSNTNNGGGNVLPYDTGPLTITPPNVPAEKLSQTPFFRRYLGPNLSNFKLYEPQYPLYSDEAAKKRWIYLPQGSQIDTNNLDEWVFPQGTILWKEFSVNGKKVETRVLEKMTNDVGPSAWRPSVYLWRVDQTDADLLTVEDFYTNPQPQQNIYEARRIEQRYRIVNTSQCMRCHAGSRDVSLGFNYLQLSSTSKAVNIETLRDENKFNNAPVALDEIPGTPAQRAGIGYLQGNCAHCHNGRSGPPHNFRHNSNVIDYLQEPVVLSVAARPGLITPGQPAQSILYLRFQGLPLAEGQPNSVRMPPLGSLVVDQRGQQLLNDWILGFNN